jgi:hypothetical protein
MVAAAPAVSLLADGVTVAGAGEITWLDTIATAGVGAVEAPDTDDGTGGVTTGTEETTAWVVVGAGTTGAGVFALNTDVAAGPRVGKLESPKA